MKNEFENKCFQKFYVLSTVSREKNATGRRRLISSNRATIFVLASQQKTTKLHFSSQVRKQFKLLRAIIWENRESQDTRQKIEFFFILPKHPF